MNCTQCGAAVEQAAKTCSRCGTRILPPPPPRWPPRPAATTAPPAADPPESAPIETPSAGSGSAEWTTTAPVTIPEAGAGGAKWKTTQPTGVKVVEKPAATIHLPDTPAIRPTQPVTPAAPVASAAPTPETAPHFKNLAAGLQAQKTAAAGSHRVIEERSSVGLFIIRILAALAILALSITSFVGVKKTNPPEWLFKWGTLEVTPKSETAYKVELVLLMLLGLFSLLAFLGRAAAARFFAFVLGVTLMGIVVGNILDRHTSNEFLTYFMIQNYFITTWICLGLAFLCALSSFWSETTMPQLRGIVVAGVGITSLTVAFIWSVAPAYSVSIARFAAG